MPGVLLIQGPKITPEPKLETPTGQSIWTHTEDAPWAEDIQKLCHAITADHPLRAWPLLVVVDDTAFSSHSLENFL